jgi:hypothetical protein
MIPLPGRSWFVKALQMVDFRRLENTLKYPFSGPFRGHSGPTRGQSDPPAGMPCEPVPDLLVSDPRARYARRSDRVQLQLARSSEDAVVAHDLWQRLSLEQQSEQSLLEGLPEASHFFEPRGAVGVGTCELLQGLPEPGVIQ